MIINMVQVTHIEDRMRWFDYVLLRALNISVWSVCISKWMFLYTKDIYPGCLCTRLLTIVTATALPPDSSFSFGVL